MTNPARHPLIIGLLLALSLHVCHQCLGRDYWISPTGSDRNAGTEEEPFSSPRVIQRLIREYASIEASNSSVRIIFRGGIYQLSTPLLITNNSQNCTICLEAAAGEQPVLSGGIRIRDWHPLNWTRAPGIGAGIASHLWVADAPKVNGKTLETRQLWVNGRKAIRARAPNGTNFSRLIAWNKTNETATIPIATLAGAKKAGALEMIINQVWEIAVLRAAHIEFDGEEARLSFKQPEGRIEFEHPWPPVIVRSNYAAPFYLVNAIELLDKPGEWFEDLPKGKIYYWPRHDENMATVECVAPALENLLIITGAPTTPVTNIQIRGLTFEYTGWLRPSHFGHVPLQAGMPMLEAHKLSPKGTDYQPKLDNVAWINRPAAAIQIKNAAQISFEDCTFEHLASAAVDFGDGTRDSQIVGCHFRDVGGNGIQLGKFSDTNMETHMPWNPADEREICSHNKIANNLITDCGAEDWGCVGIAVGYAQNTSIEHNEIFDLPYSGISLGWGWSKQTNALRDNFVFANHIHNVGKILNDLGGIYTLSAQPGTVVAENAVEDIQPSSWVPDPNHWFYLYADEGSSYMTFRDNWCPSENFLRNANGPGNVWTNNGPEVSEIIKNAAGLEPAYRHLLSK